MVFGGRPLLGCPQGPAQVCHQLRVVHADVVQAGGRPGVRVSTGHGCLHHQRESSTRSEGWAIDEPRLQLFQTGTEPGAGFGLQDPCVVVSAAFDAIRQRGLGVGARPRSIDRTPVLGPETLREGCRPQPPAAGRQDAANHHGHEPHQQRDEPHRIDPSQRQERVHDVASARGATPPAKPRLPRSHASREATPPATAPPARITLRPAHGTVGVRWDSRVPARAARAQAATAVRPWPPTHRPRGMGVPLSRRSRVPVAHRGAPGSGSASGRSTPM